MPTETAQTGTAAHIHSASLKGPRGRGELTDGELADPSNGIWCCATHGREIDTNAGRGYTVETLRGWKRVREEASRRERTGSSTPGAGWIDQIKIVEGPLFAAGSVLNLRKATILEGDGSVGKTSFYEWLAAAAGNAIFDRWRNERVRLDIRYLAPLPHRLEVTLEKGARQYLLDNAVVHVPPTDLQVVHLQEDFFPRFFYSDDLSMISGALSIDPSIVRSLAAEIVRNGSGFFQRLRFVEEPWDLNDERDNHPETYAALYVKQRSAPREQSFRSLSTSETFLLLLEFAAGLARERSRAAPTLLLIDAGGWNFSDGLWATVVEFLLSQPFQIVLTPNLAAKDATWKSWERLYLRRQDKRDATTSATIIEKRRSKG